MRYWYIGFFVGAALAAFPGAAEQIATTADGRQVVLYEDGRWAYAPSRDAQAITPPPAPPPVPAAATSRLTLVDVEVLRREKRRQKTLNVATRTVFHLNVANVSDRPLVLDEYMGSRFTAVSSRGTTFRILWVGFDTDAIAPGAEAKIQITVEDSPQWPGVSHVALEIAPNTVGNVEKEVLEKSMSEIRTREVEKFPPT